MRLRAIIVVAVFLFVLGACGSEMDARPVSDASERSGVVVDAAEPEGSQDSDQDLTNNVDVLNGFVEEHRSPGESMLRLRVVDIDSVEMDISHVHLLRWPKIDGRPHTFTLTIGQLVDCSPWFGELVAHDDGSFTYQPGQQAEGGMVTQSLVTVRCDTEPVPAALVELLKGPLEITALGDVLVVSNGTSTGRFASGFQGVEVEPLSNAVLIFENLTQCLPEGNGGVVPVDDQIWFGDWMGTGYEPWAYSEPLPKGSSVWVQTSDTPTGDLDGDGVADTLQFLSIGRPDGNLLAEGIRVCGTSRDLFPHFVPPSNGNFGALIVPFDDGPAGIVNRGPIEGNTPDDVWLFDDRGHLVAPGTVGVRFADYSEGFARLRLLIDSSEQWKDLGGDHQIENSHSMALAASDGSTITITTGWRQTGPVGTFEDLGPHPLVAGRFLTYPGVGDGVWFDCRDLSITAIGDSPFVEQFVNYSSRGLQC